MRIRVELTRIRIRPSRKICIMIRTLTTTLIRIRVLYHNLLPQDPEETPCWSPYRQPRIEDEGAVLDQVRDSRLKSYLAIILKLKYS